MRRTGRTILYLILGFFIFHLSLGTSCQLLAMVPKDGFRVGDNIKVKTLQQKKSQKSCTKEYCDEELKSNIATWKQMLVLYQKKNDTFSQAVLLDNLSSAYLQLGYYRDAIFSLESRLALYIPDHSDNPILKAKNLSNLGIAHKNLGNYQKALKYQRQAAEIIYYLYVKKSDDKSLQKLLGRILVNFGNVQEILGNYEKAQKSYLQSLKLAQVSHDLKLESIILDNIGSVFIKVGDDTQAISVLQSSLKLKQNLRNQSGQADTLINLGAIYYSRKDTQVALQNYQKGIQIAQASQNQNLEAVALSSMAMVYETLQQYSHAIQLHTQGIELAKSIGNPELQARLLNNMGHTLLQIKQFNQAEVVLRQSIYLLDSLRLNLDDRYQASVFDTQIHTYNLLQQVLVAADRVEEALEVSEQGRARAFAELLAKNEQQQLVPVTLSEIRRIAKQKQATLVEYSIVPDGDFVFRGKQKAKAAKLLIWVIQPSGKIALRQVDLQSQWKTKGTLSSIVEAALCLAPAPICPTTEELLSTHEQPSSGSFSQNEIQPLNQAESLIYPGLPELYEILIKPISDLLPSSPNEHIVLIPQESIFQVPFAALVDNNGQYLIEKHTILSAPSIQILGLTQEQAKKKRGHGKGYLIVGNPSPMPQKLAPLPASEQEAKTVAQLFQTSAIIGEQATRSKIWNQLSNKQLIHLATHGLLEYENMDELDALGALALAPSDGDNGFITANDILKTHLNAELVVLSACNTGSGKITGDGVLGLSRSWIAAGTPSIVVSLWAVNDESTSFFMTNFYKSLKEQKDKSLALRKAMLTTMKKYPSPKQWAAFMLIGETESHL
jgi:CHAT domain-containing protein/Tfp pilus assembly protein PilF